MRNLTLAYVVIYPSLARINAEFDRAARSSGAGWWTIARRILLPILRPALLAAFVLMFITLLGDYDPVVFLQKPGTEVLGVTMLQTWQRGVVGPVAALAVVQVAHRRHRALARAPGPPEAAPCLTSASTT